MFHVHIESVRQLLHECCTTSAVSAGNSVNWFCIKNSTVQMNKCSSLTSSGSIDKLKACSVNMLRQGCRSMLLECLPGLNRLPCDSLYSLLLIWWPLKPCSSTHFAIESIDRFKGLWNAFATLYYVYQPRSWMFDEQETLALAESILCNRYRCIQ